MSVFLQPLGTVSVGTSNPSTIVFSNIPQTYTDLKILISSRSSLTQIYGSGELQFNSDTSGSGTNYSMTRIAGTGSGAGSQNSPNSAGIASWDANGSSSTSNTFNNAEIYIPNYAGSNYKQVIIDDVVENNGSTGYQILLAGLWRSTAAITSVTINLANGPATFNQYSVASLYGVLRQGI